MAGSMSKDCDCYRSSEKQAHPEYQPEGPHEGSFLEQMRVALTMGGLEKRKGKHARQKRPCEQSTELITSYGNKVWSQQAGAKNV